MSARTPRGFGLAVSERWPAVSALRAWRLSRGNASEGPLCARRLGQGWQWVAAESYARMTEVSVDSGFDVSDTPLRGSTTLEAYIRDLVAPL
ncbi:hypothetical protein [Achromobacter xylosoxidans]|uniref:hypothetical protein n=1 Tax=Alcaligenes xylosoxydans xylosoxydans TaxID=85698 RepID=UPI001F429801|nr:hypothetical protein [Achromobacter xylosoxidans]